MRFFSPDPANYCNFRYLEIKNYRNLGIDSPVLLKLNRTLDLSKLGGLVILIGGNNSGKSNILSAITSINGKVSPEDYTNFGRISEVAPSLRLISGSEELTNAKLAPSLPEEYVLDILERYLLESESYLSYARRYCTEGSKISRSDYSKYIKDSVNDLRKTDVSRVPTRFKIILRGRSDYLIDGRKPEFDRILNTDANLRLSKVSIDRNPSDYFGSSSGNVGAHTVGKSNNTGLSHRVYNYKRETIKKSEFECDLDSLSPFMKKLLGVLGFSPNDLRSNSANSKYSHREDMEYRLSEAISPICDKFNRLFNAQNKHYFMKIYTDGVSGLSFVLKTDNNIELDLDKQSQGFKWTFDLFMNLLVGINYQPGDIILIDEFGNGLNFDTIAKLGDDLRDLARETGLTLVLATQNPMIIRCDYLDEIRLLVPNGDGSTQVINDFTEFAKDSHDVMQPILNGMTIGRNFMRTPERRTVFVDDYVKYFVMNSFANQIRSTNSNIDLEFLPLNGLGSMGENPDDVINTIKSLERFEPILFADSESVSEMLRECLKDNHVESVTVSEIVSQKKSVCELFSESDAKQYLPKICSFDEYSVFSHNFDRIYSELSDETKNNFRKVLRYISNINFPHT